MKSLWNVLKLSLFILILSTLGCSKDLSESNSSTLVLQMPNGFNKANSDVSSLSSKACFAVSISGDKLSKNQPGECDASYGEFAGLVGSGQSIELSVNRGKNRTLDLYYVVAENGCENFDVTKGLGKVFGSNKVYRIGHKEGIDMEQARITIHLGIQWPSSANTLSAIHSLPSSCKVGDDPVNKMAMKDAGIVLGSSSQLTQSGNAFVRVRVKNQNIKNLNQNQWGARLLPARLGVDQ